jgi:hypothetical protein
MQQEPRASDAGVLVIPAAGTDGLLAPEKSHAKSRKIAMDLEGPPSWKCRLISIDVDR